MVRGMRTMEWMFGRVPGMVAKMSQKRKKRNDVSAEFDSLA